MNNKNIDWYDVISLRLVEKYWDSKNAAGIAGMLDDYFRYASDYGVAYTAPAVVIANSPETNTTLVEGEVNASDVLSLLNSFFGLFDSVSTDIIASHDANWTPSWSPVDGLAVSLPQKILEGNATFMQGSTAIVLPVSFLVRFNGEKVNYLKVFIDMKPLLSSGAMIPDAFRTDK